MSQEPRYEKSFLQLISLIKYKDWRLNERRIDGGWLLWWEWDEHEGVQKSRKWYISAYATDSEIVQTALLAALTAAEHEVREKFRYGGQTLFGPHIDIRAHINACTHLDVRK